MRISIEIREAVTMGPEGSTTWAVWPASFEGYTNRASTMARQHGDPEWFYIPMLSPISDVLYDLEHWEDA